MAKEKDRQKRRNLQFVFSSVANVVWVYFIFLEFSTTRVKLFNNATPTIKEKNCRIFDIEACTITRVSCFFLFLLFLRGVSFEFCPKFKLFLQAGFFLRGFFPGVLFSLCTSKRYLQFPFVLSMFLTRVFQTRLKKEIQCREHE